MSAAVARGYDGRISSLIVMLVLFAAGLFIAIDSALSWRSEAEAVDNLRARTELLESRAAEAAQARPDAPGDQLDARLLIAGETSGLVSAELQRIVSGIATKLGAAVRSLDVPESEPVEGVVDGSGRTLVRVRLNAEIEVMEAALPDLIYAVETHLPILVVDSMSLQPNRRVATTSTDAYSAIDRPLALRLTVSAFHLQVPD